MTTAVAERAAERGPRTTLWRRLDAQGMGLFWVVTAAVLIAQLLSLAFYSRYLFGHFDLTDDFGQYSQAWSAIGHGHLDPVDTIYIPHFSFWRSHFELAMWPAALLRFVWPQAVDLLWLQDVAIVATEAVTLWWVAAICADHLRRGRNALGLAALVALVADPWWYHTASFDVHFEILGLPLVVLAAYSLYRGRWRRAWVAAAVALLFGNVVALLVASVGAAGLLSARVRRAGGAVPSAVVLGGGLLWTGLVSVLHADQGSGIVANYAYLAHVGPHSSSLAVASGVLAHPVQDLSVLFHKFHALELPLSLAGLVGVFSVWGLCPAVVTLVPAALNASPTFLSTPSAFQTAPAIPFVLVGTVMVLVSLSRWSPGATAHGALGPLARQAGPVIASVVALALVVSALVQGAPVATQVRSDWWKVDGDAAGALLAAQNRIPADAEVIASQGVMGRFGDHRFLYPLVAAPQAFTVDRRDVAFVLAPAQGQEVVPFAAVQADVVQARALGARTVVDRGGITVLEWRAPPATRLVVLHGTG